MYKYYKEIEEYLIISLLKLLFVSLLSIVEDKNDVVFVSNLSFWCPSDFVIVSQGSDSDVSEHRWKLESDFCFFREFLSPFNLIMLTMDFRIGFPQHWKQGVNTSINYKLILSNKYQNIISTNIFNLITTIWFHG